MKPGDKVVCVDDGPWHPDGCDELRSVAMPLKNGLVYVVRSINNQCPFSTGARLVGIHLPIGPYGHECGFLFSRFRLLSEMKAEAVKKAFETHPLKTGLSPKQQPI